MRESGGAEFEYMKIQEHSLIILHYDIVFVYDAYIYHHKCVQGLIE